MSASPKSGGGATARKPFKVGAVEKRVPLPPRRFVGSQFPFLDMAPGDSFFVPAEPDDVSRTRSRIGSAGASFAKREGGKVAFTCRAVEGGVRCWRFK